MNSGYTFVGDVALKLNELHREQMKKKLLADILMDMEVCRLEGWDIMEYSRQLAELINDIIDRKVRQAELF